MTALRAGDLAAADLLLLVPATYGKNVTLDGEPNPSFVKNRAEFVPLFKSINKPVPAAFFAGDEYDSGARGELVKQHVGDLRRFSLHPKMAGNDSLIVDSACAPTKNWLVDPALSFRRRHRPISTPTNWLRS